MRLSGQGLMGHTASTAVSRFFTKNRGKALGITWLGLSSSEFILPICITFLLSVLSWNKVWVVISLFIIIFLPLICFKTIRTISLSSREKTDEELVDNKIKHWKRIEVIRDFKFYVIASNLLAMPWIATGIFVYQSFITESKLWSTFAIPKAFMAYSVMSILTIFVTGSLIDRFTSRKIIPFMNIPLLIAMLVMYFGSLEIYSFVLFGLLGISNGLSNLLGSSTWAEIYGVKHIGSIKALTTSFMVFSTAFGTALFGILIDKKLSIESISMVCAFYIVTMFAFLIVFRKKIEPIKLVN
jgi:predicted MFS family arabinose efflux permease